MYTISGFADEIADDLDTQLEVFSDLGIDHVDLRSVDGVNVVDFTDDDVDRISARLEEYGISVAAIGSPIGKISITDDFEPHKEDFRRILELADAFDADYVRHFSYWIPEDDHPEEYRAEVLRRMRWKASEAETAGIPIYHENEKDIYGDTPARCRDLATSIDSAAFGLIFDPANFLEIGVQPYPDGLLQLVEHVDALHIKDAVRGERGNIAPAGEGDGRIPETLQALADRGFSGYAALEPHLAMAGEMGGYSGPEAFEVATDALTDILEAQDLEYR